MELLWNRCGGNMMELRNLQNGICRMILAELAELAKIAELNLQYLWNI